MMKRQIGVVLLAASAFLAGCSSQDSTRNAPAQPLAGAPEAAGQKSVVPLSEDPKERTRRLLYLERALERWWEADRRQQYARRDSMAGLIRTYAADNFEAMVGDLRHGTPRQRIVMSGTLGFSGNPDAVGPLTEALKDQYYEVVLHSLASFYHLAGTRTPQGGRVEIPIDPKLIIAYLSHPRAEVRSTAAVALSRILGPESPDEYLVPLIAAAADSDKPTRANAIGAIGAMRRRSALPHLVNALQDEVQLVRIRAALGLGRLGDIDAVFYLVELMEREDEKEDVRKACARSLAVILKQPLTFDSATWRSRAAEAGVPGMLK